MATHHHRYLAWDDHCDYETTLSSPGEGRSVHHEAENDESEDIIDYGAEYIEDRNFTSSDDSPLINYRYDKYKRFAPYVPVNKPNSVLEKRISCSTLAKFFLFCSAMIMFCVLMYIPVYSRVNQMPRAIVAGWSIHTNRDTKLYIQPNNVTTVNQPRNICSNDKKLFLIIIVYSATTNFEHREAIRKTWADYGNYIEMSKLFKEIKEKYINYNYTYDLYPLPVAGDDLKTNSAVVKSTATNRVKRSISYGLILPKLADVLKKTIDEAKTDVVPEKEEVEKRFDDDDDVSDDDSDKFFDRFDMNSDLGKDFYKDYDYETNVMKIPPNGYQDTPSLGKILLMLKRKNPFSESNISDKRLSDILSNVKVSEEERGDPVFKLVFLLGLPSQDNDTAIQGKIDEEIDRSGDIIQEGFIDSYNNLTLKSIMMLKWVVTHCKDSVRYIFKTDDDMFINTPNLITTLMSKAEAYDKRPLRNGNDKEYLLIGDLIFGARPVSDSRNKWYSPRYMYSGRVYPRYLSGTGYVMSIDTAQVLYQAALRTPYFHLEDIYITGMCAGRARPRVPPRDHPLFSYVASPPRPPRAPPCALAARASAHRVPPPAMRALLAALRNATALDECERIRLTKIRRDRMKPKATKSVRKHLKSKSKLK